PTVCALSLHDALPIYRKGAVAAVQRDARSRLQRTPARHSARVSLPSWHETGWHTDSHEDADQHRSALASPPFARIYFRASQRRRSEEHTSELQSRSDL